MQHGVAVKMPAEAKQTPSEEVRRQIETAHKIACIVREKVDALGHALVGGLSVQARGGNQEDEPSGFLNVTLRDIERVIEVQNETVDRLEQIGRAFGV